MRSVVPAVKALITKRLMEEQGLKQDQVAELLGISQSAVSKYSRKLRGHAVDIDGLEEIWPFINDIIAALLDNKQQSKKLLQLFCKTCVAIRRTSLMCTFCEKSDPKIKIGECRVCVDMPA